MAGGIVLLSIMTFFIPFQIIIPIHGAVQFISNSTRSFFLRENIKWSYVFSFGLGAPIGAFFAFKIITQINNPKIFLSLILFSILYALFRPKNLPALKLKPQYFSLLGISIGFLGPLIGATGPFLASFFLRDDFNKKEIVGTKAAVQTIGHLVKFPVFFQLSFDYAQYAPTLGAMFIISILGTKTGVWLLDKVNEKHFIFIYKTALFIAAMRLAYKIFL